MSPFDPRGDFILQLPDGTCVFVECKAERKWTGNLFVETWSNRATGRPGWFHTLKTNVLLYHFIDRDLLYVYPWNQFHAFVGPRMGQYREAEQRATPQANDTWGRLFPIADLPSGLPGRWA